MNSKSNAQAMETEKISRLLPGLQYRLLWLKSSTFYIILLTVFISDIFQVSVPQH